MSSDDEEMRALRGSSRYLGVAKYRLEQKAQTGKSQQDNSSEDDEVCGPQPLGNSSKRLVVCLNGQSHGTAERKSDGITECERSGKYSKSYAGDSGRAYKYSSNISEDERTDADPEDDDTAAQMEAMGLPSSFSRKYIGGIGKDIRVKDTSSTTVPKDRDRNSTEDNFRSYEKETTIVKVKPEQDVGSGNEIRDKSSFTERRFSRNLSENDGRQIFCRRLKVMPKSCVGECSFPIDSEMQLRCHDSVLTTCFSLARKGNRMVTGGSDGSIKWFDFFGMRTQQHLPVNQQAYRSIQGLERHRVARVRWGGVSGMILAALGDVRCCVYSADAEMLYETCRGDMYIRDLANTKGHTHAVTDAFWHPLDPNLFITASLDSSIRIWDVNARRVGMDLALPHVHCLKATDTSGRNSSVTSCYCCLYTPTGGGAIVAGCRDGSLQMWGSNPTRKVYGRPDGVVRDAHGAIVSSTRNGGISRSAPLWERASGAEVLCLVCGKDDYSLYSRGGDGSVAAWDLRNFRKPKRRWTELPTEDQGAGICLSKDESQLLVTTQVKKIPPADHPGTRRGHGPQGRRLFSDHSKDFFTGSIHIFDMATYEERFSIAFEQYAPLSLEWDSNTDQIFMTNTDGSITVLYNSANAGIGAASLTAVEKGSSRKIRDWQEQIMHDELTQQQHIYAADELPEGFVETYDGRLVQRRLRPKQRLEAFEATQKTKLPPIPSKLGMNGQPGAVGNRSLHMLKEMNLIPSASDLERMRTEKVAGGVDLDEIMKGISPDDSKVWTESFISRAYAKTQPKPILDFMADEEEADQVDKFIEQRSKCTKCGLRTCQCEEKSNKKLRLLDA